jgi:hypothetical protein
MMASWLVRTGVPDHSRITSRSRFTLRRSSESAPRSTVLANRPTLLPRVTDEGRPGAGSCRSWQTEMTSSRNGRLRARWTTRVSGFGTWRRRAPTETPSRNKEEINNGHNAEADA